MKVKNLFINFLPFFPFPIEIYNKNKDYHKSRACRLLFKLSGLLISAVFFLNSMCLMFSNIAMAAAPIKIAAIFAETGIAARDNKPALNSAALVVKDINKKGGINGRTIQLIIIDNKSTPIGSKAAAKKAVRLGVSGVIGPAWSSHAIQAALVLQKARIPMISPTSTDPQVTKIGDYVFRACYNDSFQGKVMAEFASHELGAKTAVILKNTNEIYSLTLAKFFRKYFTKNGGQIAWEGPYRGNAVNFKDILIKSKNLNPDVVFIPGYARDSGLIIRQAAKIGLKSTFLGADGWSKKMVEYGGIALNGNYYSTHWHPDVAFKENADLKALYTKTFGKESYDDMRIPLTRDALMLLVNAISRAGTIDRKKIRDELAKTKNFKGATGTISFDKNGDPINKEASIIKFQKSKMVLIKSEHL